MGWLDYIIHPSGIYFPDFFLLCGDKGLQQTALVSQNKNKAWCLCFSPSGPARKKQNTKNKPSLGFDENKTEARQIRLARIRKGWSPFSP